MQRGASRISSSFKGGLRRRVWLDSEVDLATMKEPYQPKAHGQDDGEHQDFAVIAKSALDGASDEAIGQVVEAQKLMRQIDGDRVHANPYKGQHQ